MDWNMLGYVLGAIVGIGIAIGLFMTFLTIVLVLGLKYLEWLDEKVRGW